LLHFFTMNRLFLFFVGLLVFVGSCQSKHEPQKERVYYENQKELIAKAKAFDQADQIDSAYYYYQEVLQLDIQYQDSLNIAKSYVNLMALEEKMNDFPSSEARCAFLVDFGKRHQLPLIVCDAYNFLGLNAMGQHKYEVALANMEDLKQYYRSHAEAMDTTLYFLNYHTNTGNIYAALKDYTTSNSYYDVLIAHDSVQKYALLDYARAIDNKAKNYLDNGSLDVAFPLMMQALQLRQIDSIPSSLIMSYMHLAQYYLVKKDNQTATAWAQKSLQTCQAIHNVHDALTTLQLLSKSDPQRAPIYFDRYVTLKDSILHVERTYKDQAARIRLESREMEQHIAVQDLTISRRNVALMGGSLLVLLLLTGAYWIWKQKQRIATQNVQLEDQLIQIRSLQMEMHHRIKNSLEKVTMYISVQKNALGDYAIDLTNKVKSMLFIHQQLLEHPTQTDIDLQGYLEKIVANTLLAYDAVQLQTNVVADFSLSDQHAVKIGGIVTELVTNSVKYAFAAGAAGTIQLKLTREGQTLTLVYEDNGKGLDTERMTGKEASVGMRTIRGIVEQEYRGRFEVKTGDGFVVGMEFRF